MEKKLVRAFSVALAGTVLVCAGLASGVRRASAELFVLQSGAKVSGEVVPQDPPDKENLTIKTDSGTTITLARSQIKEGHGRPGQQCNDDGQISYRNRNLKGQWPLAPA